MSKPLVANRRVVLVVEDEPLLLIYAADIVAEAGFEAVEATNADAAIKILIARPEICIVFTDIKMPGSIDGLKLAHFIRERYPPIELLITSGEVQPKPDQLPARGIFLGKPFQPERLVAALRAFAA